MLQNAQTSAFGPEPVMKSQSFDGLVGTVEQRGRHGEAEHLDGALITNELEDRKYAN